MKKSVAQKLEEETEKLVALEEKQLEEKIAKASSLSEEVLEELKDQLDLVAMKRKILNRKKQEEDAKPITKAELDDLVKKAVPKKA